MSLLMGTEDRAHLTIHVCAIVVECDKVAIDRHHRLWTGCSCYISRLCVILSFCRALSRPQGVAVTRRPCVMPKWGDCSTGCIPITLRLQDLPLPVKLRLPWAINRLCCSGVLASLCCRDEWPVALVEQQRSLPGRNE